MRLPGFLVTTLSFFVICSPSIAHEGATGVVKQRMHLMKSLGKGMKQMRGMTKGKVALDQQAFINHIQDLKQGSLQMKQLFPEGSMQPPTEARAVIWKNWEQFENLSDKLLSESEKLERAFTTQDQKQVSEQLKRVGKVCLQCHKKFRKKKKN